MSQFMLIVVLIFTNLQFLALAQFPHFVLDQLDSIVTFDGPTKTSKSFHFLGELQDEIVFSLVTYKSEENVYISGRSHSQGNNSAVRTLVLFGEDLYEHETLEEVIESAQEIETSVILIGTLSKAKMALKLQTLDIESRIFIVSWTNNKINGQYKLYESFQPFEGADLHYNKLGFFAHNGSLVKTASSPIWQRRSNLTGLHLTAGISLEHPYNTMILPNGQISGYFGEVFKELQRIVNFTASYETDPFNMYGSVGSDGVTFNGLVGMLQRGEISIIVADVSVSELRAQVCDFTMGIFEYRHTVVFKRDKPVSYSLYSKVFGKDFWTVLGITCLVLILSLQLTRQRIEVPIQAARYLLSALVAREIVPQQERRVPVRILNLSSLFLGLLVMSIYSAMLTSFFSVNEIQIPATNIKEILDNDNVKLALKNGTYSYDTLRNADPKSLNYRLYAEKVLPFPDAIYSQMGKEMDTNGISRFHPHKKGLLNDGFALLVGHNYIETYEEYPCEVVNMPTTFMHVSSAFAFPKGSKLVKLFDYHVSKLKENGVMEKWFKEFYHNPVNRDRNFDCQTLEISGLGFKATLSCFLIVGLGGLAAVAIVVLEIVWSRFVEYTFQAEHMNETLEIVQIVERVEVNT